MLSARGLPPWEPRTPTHRPHPRIAHEGIRTSWLPPKTEGWVFGEGGRLPITFGGRSGGLSALMRSWCHRTETSLLNAFFLHHSHCLDRDQSIQAHTGRLLFSSQEAQTMGWGENLRSPHKQGKAERQLPDPEAKQRGGGTKNGENKPL